MARFVLVHGAFHGAWCWRFVAEILRARGHEVSAPTLTGLGERRHLLSPRVEMQTFCADVLNHLRYEDAREAVLVGHSFAGAPISKAAELAPERVARLVYLDAMLLEGDETPFDVFPPATRATREALAHAHDGGVSIPPPAPESFGVGDPAQAAWLAERLTPHPLATYRTAARLGRPPGAEFAKVYVHCVAPDYAPLRWAAARAREAGWPIQTLAAGHDAMVTAPQAVADLLEREAAA
ncbi:alpha/beta hydrolase family protein [Oceanicella actignis]|uniref:Pimeloyl-ACP methyl ester carboxylesterase n=1 Tax=Oceanicella actignis TaxID=1189325 RepID=A0A1M7T9H7_9RHOB|nr:alpha/beta hydrolase [Oceanicella actignis]SET51019.1 Pimeloyl-ACP methyl ester carboxylesterase [Oceanicella actignis]SHN67362.1 Pimeloyl-ACP methyl ester carboxylesterase [Oceanicella actignis]